MAVAPEAVSYDSGATGEELGACLGMSGILGLISPSHATVLVTKAEEPPGIHAHGRSRLEARQTHWEVARVVRGSWQGAAIKASPATRASSAATDGQAHRKRRDALDDVLRAKQGWRGAPSFPRARRASCHSRR